MDLWCGLEALVDEEAPQHRSEAYQRADRPCDGHDQGQPSALRVEKNGFWSGLGCGRGDLNRPLKPRSDTSPKVVFARTSQGSPVPLLENRSSRRVTSRCLVLSANFSMEIQMSTSMDFLFGLGVDGLGLIDR